MLEFKQKLSYIESEFSKRIESRVTEENNSPGSSRSGSSISANENHQLSTEDSKMKLQSIIDQIKQI